MVGRVKCSTMGALVRVVAHSSKTKVQEPFGFVKLHEAMRITYYFSGFPETSCDVQPQNSQWLAADSGGYRTLVMSSEADETIGGKVLGGRPGIWKECKAPWLRESEFKCSDHMETIEEFKILASCVASLFMF